MTRDEVVTAAGLLISAALVSVGVGMLFLEAGLVAAGLQGYWFVSGFAKGTA